MRWLLLIVSLSVAAPSLADPPRRPGLAQRERPRAPWNERMRAQEDGLLASIEESDPETFAELSDLKTRADAGDQEAQELYTWRMFQEARKVRRARRPGGGRTSTEVRERKQRLRRIALGEETATEAEIRTVVSEIFEIRQGQRRHALEELEARLEQLRQEVEEQDAQREEIIEHYTERVRLGDPDL